MAEQIDAVVLGLKNLFVKMTATEETAFASKEEQLLKQMQELFVNRQKHAKKARQIRNAALPCMKVTLTVWVTRILPYLQLDEQLECAHWCSQMRSYVKSTLFLKFQISTQVDYIEQPAHKTIQTKKREDTEAQLETLSTVNQFLTQKLKQNEQVV